MTIHKVEPVYWVQCKWCPETTYIDSENAEGWVGLAPNETPWWEYICPACQEKSE